MTRGSGYCRQRVAEHPGKEKKCHFPSFVLPAPLRVLRGLTSGNRQPCCPVGERPALAPSSASGGIAALGHRRLTAIRPRQVRAFTLQLIDPGHALNRQAGAILFLPSAGTGLVFRTSPFDLAASPDAWPRCSRQARGKVG
jgi:hypothetical protein